VAALVCARFPLRYGIGETMVTLDSIPLVLAVALFDPGAAIIVGLVTTSGAMIGQPPLVAGRLGYFWRLITPLSTALIMGVTSMLAEDILGVGRAFDSVLLVPAFVIALVLEVAFALSVVVEIEATEPGMARHWLKHSVFPSAANVMLPTFATAVLTNSWCCSPSCWWGCTARCGWRTASRSRSGGEIG
jgi:hypothetical protein